MNLLFRYIKNLGFRVGITLFLQAEFFKFQKIRMVNYPRPVYLRPSTTDIKVFREVFLFGLYTFNMESAPRIIVDAGANIGLSSIFFSERFPGATVYAIEPEGTNFVALKRNVQGYFNIRPMQTALWNRDAALKITNLMENHWAFTVEECSHNDPAAFPAISMASFMQLHGIKTIDLLKLDIEGAERELFSDNYEFWLSRTKGIIVELHDWLRPGCSSNFFRAVAAYDIKTTLHEGLLFIEINR